MNRRTLLAALVAAPAAATIEVAQARGEPLSIDARGATSDLLARLPQILRESNERLEARIIADLRRGRLT